MTSNVGLLHSELGEGLLNSVDACDGDLVVTYAADRSWSAT
jgi:hypothetical protein